jgi:hypothetical protein
MSAGAARAAPAVRAAAGLGLGALAYGLILVFLHAPILGSPWAAPLLCAAVLGEATVAFRLELHRDPIFLAAWIGFAAALAIVSAATGYLNGLTDEPYATPAFAALFPNLYGGALHLSYTQYGTGPYTLNVGYVYLPLLPLLAIPYVDYRATALLAWAGILYFARRRPMALVLVGSPWVALLAANGFNDPVPLALLTIAFTLPRGAGSRAAEIVALGVKQFANAFVVVYYLVLRRWWEAALAAAVTVAFLVPFALLDASGVVCHAIYLNSSPTCAAGASVTSASAVVSHLNYWIWPLWAIGMFAASGARILGGPRFAADRARAARWMGRASFDVGRASWGWLLVPVARVVRGRGPGGR